MAKKLIALFVLLVTFFFANAPVYAAANNADKYNMPVSQESVILNQAVTPEFQVAGGKVEPWYWALSFLLPGLGHFFLGEVMRGLMFLAGCILLPVIAGIVATVVGVGSVAAASSTLNPAAALGGAGLAGIIGLVGSGLGLALYIWNVVDAYFLNQEKMGSSNAALIERQAKLAEVMATLKVNNTNGAVSYNLAF